MPLSLLKPLTEAQYRRWERFAIVGMAVGLVWAGVCIATKFNVGLISAVQSLFMGAAAGCYASRHTEKGIWMLAGLIGSMSTMMLVLMTVGQVRAQFRGARPDPLPIACDLTLATAMLTWTARASWTVIKQNKALK